MMKRHLTSLITPLFFIIITFIFITTAHEAAGAAIKVSNPKEILKAANSLGSKGGVIVLKKGSYNGVQVLRLKNLKNITIKGEGSPEDTVLTFSAKYKSVFFSQYVIYLYNCQNTHIKNFTFLFKDCSKRYMAALGFIRCKNISLENCTFKNKDPNLSRGVHLGSSKDITISQCRIEKFSLYAIDLWKVTKISITGCTITGTQLPVRERVVSELTHANNSFGSKESTDSSSLMKKIEQYMKAGDNKKALVIIKKLIFSHPAKPEGWITRSIIERRLNLFEESRISLQKALKNGSDAHKVLYYSGLSYLDFEDFKGAIKEFQKSLRAKPGYKPAKDGLKIARQSIKKNPHYIVYDVRPSGWIIKNNRKFYIKNVYMRNYKYVNINSKTAEQAPSKLRLEISFKGLAEKITLFLKRTPEGWVLVPKDKTNYKKKILYNYSIVRSGVKNMGRIYNYTAEYDDTNYEIQTAVTPRKGNVLKNITIVMNQQQGQKTKGVKNLSVTLKLKESGYLYKSIYTKKQLVDIRRMDFTRRITTVPPNISKNLQVDYIAHLPSLVRYLVKGIKDDVVKAKIIHDWIAYHFKYAYDGAWNFQRTFITYEGVCHTYLIIYQYMCKIAGLDIGYESNGIHGFNTIVINNKLYFIDVTWDGTKKKRVLTKWLFRPYEVFSRKKNGDIIESHIPNKKEIRIGNKKPAMEALIK